jgi:hypothetical protein
MQASRYEGVRLLTPSERSVIRSLISTLLILSLLLSLQSAVSGVV